MRGLFFLLGVLGIVLALNIDLKAKPIPVVFPTPTVFELAEVEGLVANIFIQEDEVPTECSCKGTKEIESGDGLIKVPCPCGDGCKCTKDIGDLPKAPPAEPNCATTQVQLPNPFAKGNQFNKVKKKYILVYVGAEWCGPCHWVRDNAFPKLKEEKWDFENGKFSYTIGEEVDNMIITVDYDKESMDQLCEFLGIEKPQMSLPTFWKIDVQNKKHVSEVVGSRDAEQIHSMYTTK